MKPSLSFKIKIFLFLVFIGLVIVTKMFTSYMAITANPSETALVKVNLESIKIGGYKTINWKNKPVIIVRRKTEDVLLLNKMNHKFYDPLSTIDKDPKYILKIQRSIKPEFFIAYNISTYCGCALKYQKQWEHIKLPGGAFDDPCHLGTYDISGRLLKTTFAIKTGPCAKNKMSNMKIPPHYFESENILIIGATS